MTLKLPETQLGKIEPLFERSEFGAIFPASCVFGSFSGIKVLEQQTPNPSLVLRVSKMWFHTFAIMNTESLLVMIGLFWYSSDVQDSR